MQTFLPYADFAKSASVLDYRRLGKQRSEALTLLRGGWPNHPASKMWRGYYPALAQYGIAICEAWIARGYNDTCLSLFKKVVNEADKIDMPPWLGNESFHYSHRSNLIRKLPEHYLPIFGPHDMVDYVWPTV